VSHQRQAPFLPLFGLECAIGAYSLPTQDNEKLPPRANVSIEYKIKFPFPADYDPSALFKQLSSPINRATMSEIYNYRIEQDGFYFVDRLVNDKVASTAFKLFVNEALRHAGSVQIVHLTQ
jgi:hypothetical protein